MSRDVHTIDWAAVLIRSAIGTAHTAKPKPYICDGVAAELPAIFEHFDILTPTRQMDFIAQAIVEAAYFQTLEEYASGDAYDTRTDLGFTPERDGDGRRHKGFGIFQTTGPKNQLRALRALRALGFDVPDDVTQAKAILTQPKWAAWSAGIFWNDNRLNKVSDSDPTGRKVGRAINRGNPNSGKPANGEAERLRARKAVWKELQNPRLLAAPIVVAPPVPVSGIAPKDRAVLDRLGTGPGLAGLKDAVVKVDPAATVAEGPAPGQDPEEHAEQVEAGKTPDAGPPSPATPLPAEPVAPGHSEALIQATQARLRERGFYGVGTPDGEAGFKTVQAVAGFQAVAGLPVTGQLDKATMDLIWAADAPRAPVAYERATATVSDLKGKSEIVDEAAKVKTASIWQVVGGAVAAAGSAVVSGFSDKLQDLEQVREVFANVPAWAWGLGVLVVVGAPAAYSYVKANRVQAARVEDHRTGRTA